MINDLRSGLAGPDLFVGESWKPECSAYHAKHHNDRLFFVIICEIIAIYHNITPVFVIFCVIPVSIFEDPFDGRRRQ